MFFNPEKFCMGDSWQYSDGETVHSFYLQWRQFDDMSDSESGSVGHAVSHDMICWKELSPALIKGKRGEYDELDLWTGSCIEKDGVLYLFYTSRNTVNSSANAISLAMSYDGGKTFEKYKNNPILTPDPCYYCSESNKTSLAVHGNTEFSIVDCRDMHAVYDPKSGYYYGYIAMRAPASECTATSVIGTARSRDLISWEQLPPCFAPNKYHCIETPDVFELNGKWYLLCLSGNHYGQRNPTDDPNMTGCITIYAVSDSPEGPFTEPKDNVLLGSSQLSGICAKTVLHKGKRYLFYTQSNGDIRTLAYPKEVIADADGRLKLMRYDGPDNLLEQCEGAFKPDKALENDGRWGSIVPISFQDDSITLSPTSDWALQMLDCRITDFALEVEIEYGCARSAGIVFGMQGDNVYSDNRLALLDFEANEVWLTRLRNFPKLNAKKYRFGKDRCTLTLAVIDTAVEIYVDGELVVHHQQPKMSGRIGLFAERGSISFKNPVLYTVKESLNDNR